MDQLRGTTDKREREGREGGRNHSLKWRMTEIEGSVTAPPPFLLGNNLVSSDQVRTMPASFSSGEAQEHMLIVGVGIIFIYSATVQVTV